MNKCIIIDDEPLAIELLVAYLKDIPELTVVATFTNPIECLHFLKNTTVDLIFLDINMPELSGLQVAKLLPTNTKIIFTTAYPNFAVEGFEINALDYLVKPISFERFQKSVQRYLQLNLKKPKQIQTSETIFIKVEHRLQKINLKEVLFLKGMGDYVQIFTENNNWMTLETMKHFEALLTKLNFIRVHKSYIVSIAHIDSIRKNRITIGEHKIPIGATYLKSFEERIGLI